MCSNEVIKLIQIHPDLREMHHHESKDISVSFDKFPEQIFSHKCLFELRACSMIDFSDLHKSLGAQDHVKTVLWLRGSEPSSGAPDGSFLVNSKAFLSTNFRRKLRKRSDRHKRVYPEHIGNLFSLHPIWWNNHYFLLFWYIVWRL